MFAVATTGVTLFGAILVLCGAAANSLEIHAGHPATHATELWRPPKPRHRRPTLLASLDDEDERIANLTTALEDMRSEYTGYIGVGTSQDGGPAFQARVVFDTGSTNLWVASSLCRTSCHLSLRRSFYDPTESTTQEAFGDAGGDIDVRFGTGELRGPLHVDTYRVGPMVVQRQPFAMIRQMSGRVFSTFPFEGILGLGFRSLSFGGITPFFDRVIEQKLLENNEFAFFLNADSSQPSAILWGGVDPDLFEGPIRMFPVIQTHYWALELVDFRIGGESLFTVENRVRKVIVDSGTTYFTAPSQLFSSVVARIPSAPCDDVDAYEPLSYVLRNAEGDTWDLVITQDAYMVAEGGNCRPAFMSLDVNKRYGPALILGEVFMRHFFTVFSRGNGSDSEARIGFAPAKTGAMPKVKKSARPSLMHLEEKEVLPNGELRGRPHMRRESRLSRLDPDDVSPLTHGH